MGLVTSHTKVIDGITYTTETLPGSKGIQLLPKIVALVGPAAAKSIFRPAEEGEEAVDPTDQDSILAKLSEPTTVAMMLAAVSDKIAEADVLKLLTDLLATTNADKVRMGEAEVPGSVVVHFDTHFQGRYLHLLKVAMWVGQVNFFSP